MNTPAATSPLLDWALAREKPGTIIELRGNETPSPLFAQLLEHRWRGLYVATDPHAVAEASDAFRRYSGNAIAMCAAVTPSDDRFLVLDNVLLVAGLHPQALHPMFTEPNPPLPGPRIVVCTLPVSSYRVLDVLSQWARIDAFTLTVADNAEAQLAGAWLANPEWKVLLVDDSPNPTVHAARANA